MQQGLEFLKTLDIKEIQTKTHISHVNIEAILNKSYEKLERVNLVGFISILQREYKIDLSDFIKEFEVYTQEHSSEKPESSYEKERYKSQSSSKKWWWVLLLLIVAVMAFFYINNTDLILKQYHVAPELNDSQIEEAKEKLPESESLQPYLQKSEINTSKAAKLEENNTRVIEDNLTETFELNATQMSEIVKEIAPLIQNEAVMIIPKKKVWIGMIELPSMKKINRVTTRQIKIDDSKNWLIVFGHGQVNIKKDGELLEFNKRGKIYFIYEDGKLKQIKKAEFKMHNQGKLW